MAQHSHSYSGTTTWSKNHIHHFGGISTKAPSGVPHVHNLHGTTTYNHEHEHSYAISTGPAIFLKSGLHTHHFRARVETVIGHFHYIYGTTSAD
ncbi:MAG: YmaF family protein [Solirubrobacterales bacterium]